MKLRTRYFWASYLAHNPTAQTTGHGECTFTSRGRIASRHAVIDLLRMSRTELLGSNITILSWQEFRSKADFDSWNALGQDKVLSDARVCG
jgi:hypothetical protein